ncbi:MAG: PKD domain-containing protein [Lentimicrobiaceae bacterium]|nr:PKD domain-containing protein [Lentimicrobiaceae bacterium]
MKRKLLILFLTCVVGWLSPLNAQTTVTVGSGTGSCQTISTGAYSEIPATFTQQIYTSTELSTAGISSGSYISSIAFTVGGTVGTSTFNWTVYMTEVDKGSFSSSSDFVILDDAPLFSGNVTLDGNLCNIEFQPPYQYNGGNLLVAVLDNMGTTNGSSTSFLTHDIGGWPNYYAIAARHTSAIDVSNPTAAIQKQVYAYRNNIQFTIGSGPTVKVTEESESAIDLNKQYRIKDVNTNQYLNIYQITSANIGSSAGYSGVNLASSSNNDGQIFKLEEADDGKYYFKSVNGYYISHPNSWMVSAYETTVTSSTAKLELEDAGNNNFYIKNGSTYYKVEYQEGAYRPYCDGGTSNRATWTLEEYVKPPLEITSAYASASEVYTGETVTLTASATGGSGSYTYNWTCTEGSPAATDFYNTDQAVATFKPTSAGTYKFTCTVNDGTSSVTSEEIEVVVLDSSTKCTIVFEMTDSYGDGWNGSYLQVSYGDKVVNVEYNDPDPYTNTDNQKITETLNVPTGSQITVSFITGSYASECSYVIKYEDETIIYSVSQGNAPNSTITFEACGDIPLMLTLSADNDAKGCEGSDIQLTATATGGTENYSYIWEIVSGGGSLKNATAANPTFTPEAVGSGTVSNEVTLKCTVDDGETTSSDDITLTVYKKPVFELPASVVVNYGETATIEVVYEPEPSYMNINGPDYTNYTYKTSNPANPDTIVLSYVPTVDADLVFEADNNFSYSNTIGDYLCNETKTVQVRVVNENKEVEIGTNEDLSSREYLPVYTEKNYSITQQIYTAEELDIKESSQINSISFYATWCNNNARNIDVYLVKTDKEAFSTTTDFVNMLGTATPNYSGNVSGNVTFVQDNWTTISFTEPFTYEPGTNILVCVNDKTGSTDGSAFEFGHYSTTEARSIVRYSSSDTPYDATNIDINYGYTTDGFLNQNNHIKLGYVAEAQTELEATINVDATEICYGENYNRFEMYATKVENATYDWYLVVDGVDYLLEENVREYTYSNANSGTYTIKLVVTQNGVSKEDIEELIINPTPNAAVVMGTNGYGFVGETLTYTVNDHKEGTKYAIELVVDGALYPASSNPEDETDIGSHVFDNDGTFYYTVDADRKGCTAEKTHSVIIYPKATFDVNNLCAGQEVEFTNTTYTPNGGWNFGEGEGFVWNFNGEEVVSNNATVTHTFAEAGTYPVTLTVTKSGVSNVATQSVFITASPVVVNLSWDKTTIYEDITFTATSNIDASYIWEIDDVVQVDKNEATFTYQFQSLGDHKVAVTAVSATGCSTRREETITITEKSSEPKVMVNNVEVSSIDMGYRPIKAWMRPIDIVITPDGTTNLQINSITIEDNYVELDEHGNVVEGTEMVLNYAMLTSPVNNVTLTPGGEPLSLQLTHDLNNETFYEGFFGGYGADATFAQESAKMIINYGDGQKKEIQISYIVYEPYVGDVYEKPYVVNSNQYSVTATDMLHNYLLEGATSKHSDAVFKMTIEEGKAADIDVTVTGTNPLVYVYPDDFGGEGGPGLTNYVGYGEQSTGVFFGFEFNFEDATGLSLTDKDGNGNNFVVDYNVSPYYLRSSRTSVFGGTENNQCWTLDKYYVSEEAKLSYDINVVTAGQYYEILLSENEDYSEAVVLKSATQAVNANFETVTLDLSEYAGKKYYFGIRHNSSVNGMIKFDNYRLYEEDTRATREGTTFNFMLGEGTYYIVAAAQFENISSSNSFNVNITSENLEAPEKAVAVSPQDKALGIATTIGQLKWNFGANTEKYQVLFGTTNPPTETMIEWNNYLEANPSCPLSDLTTNTVYYWRVDAQNPAGTTEGDLWRFATDFDAPQNLVLSKEVIDLGQTSELSWTGVDFGEVEGYYNILVDGEKWGESVTKTTTTFVLSGLPYKNEPYEITVEAVYPIDDWDVTAESESVALKVNTYSMGVKGYVYDDYTKEPIQGATVTYGTAFATTNESGYYSIITALAGSYIAGASCTGYIRNEVLVNVPTDKEFEQDFYLVSAKTMPEVVATERDENVVDVEWTLNSISEPMYEDFENGAFKYNWKTSADYPWEVVANGFVDDVEDDDDDYDFFGGYCVKSTNSDYDIDPINPDTGEKYDDGVYEFGETTSFLELEVYVPYSTTMRFYYRISSTGNYLSDYGRFLVNGEQVGENYLGKGSWSRSGYTDYTVEGDQTYKFRWEYVKDDGNYFYEDAFFIDNIRFHENTNLYNVYVKDILSDDEPTPLATGITAEEYEYTDWATKTDGIYQWGVSAIYNEQGNTLSEDFSDETMSMGWTKTDLSTGWNNWLILNQQVDGLFQAYDGYSIICSGLDSNEKFYLVTPEIDASIQSTLEFVCIAPQYGNLEEYFNKFRVVYGDTPTGPWTPLTDYNTASVEDWTLMEVSLPLQKTLYIAFENYDHDTGYGLGLDNVVVRRETVTGESNIAWSNLIGKGNKLVTNNGDWSSATSWSRTHIPTAEEVAIIKAAGTVNGTGAVAKAVLVDNGTLTIGEGGVLTASTVIDSVAADITINAGGQLVHSNKGVMATFVKGIQAYTDADNNDGWYTISSPLAADIDASEVTNLLSGEFDLYRYDEPTHYWENYEDDVDDEGPNNTDWDNNSAVIEKGRGYLYANSANTELSFAGELNVADVTTTLSAEASSLKGFNLLGNPFAHNIYKGAAFNGNLAEAHYTLNYHGEWQVVTSDNPIKSGAGFLVQAKEGADLTISKTNARTRAAANSMLAVTVVNNVFEDVAYVSFNDGIGLEKIGHMNEYAPMVYIPGDFNNYAYATVEEDVTEVPVNFEAMTMGEYTIAVKAKNCEYETMILVDNLTGKETNLLKDSYTFMATTTDDPDRFVIKLAKDAEVEDSFIYINNGELIFDNLSNDAIINVFDVLGRNVATFNNCGDTTFRVSTDLFADGVYMVRVIEGNNVKVQKMVIE